MGSSTRWPRLVKNSTNSCARVSGNLAGCRRAWRCRGGGLWTNQDFWKRSHSLGLKSLRRLRKGRLGGMGLGSTGGRGGGPQSAGAEGQQGHGDLWAARGAGRQAEAAAGKAGLAQGEDLHFIEQGVALIAL